MFARALPLVAACGFFIGDVIAAPTPVNVTASTFTRQQFKNFGFSMVGGSIENATYAAVKEDILTHLVDDLHATVLRLWWGEQYPMPAGDNMKFEDAYTLNNLTVDFQRHGVTQLLLAPGGPKPTNVSHEAMRVADFIYQLHKNGTDIAVTGIGNEPGLWNATDCVEMVRIVRQNLTAYGLEDVKVIAPEWASQDGTGLERVEFCKNDTLTCWDDLFGIAGHSYGMAATDEWAATILPNGSKAGPGSKAYWVTEAGGGDTFNESGTSMASRFLNDMNHMVDTWVWFIGSELHDPHTGQDSMRLIVTWKNGTSTTANTWADYKAAVAGRGPWPMYTLTPTWSYAHQLMQTFDLGATLRYCLTNSSSRGGGGASMTWTYGKKEAFNVAVGQNPDGSWAIGVSNPTGLANSTYHGSPIAAFPNPEDFEMTVIVPELAGAGELQFEAVLSVADTTLEQSLGNVTMVDGQVTVHSPSNSLVTLRSRVGAGSAALHLAPRA